MPKWGVLLLASACACGATERNDDTDSVAGGSTSSTTMGPTVTSSTATGTTGGTRPDPNTASGRHVFGPCQDECAEGLNCVCGMCTVECDDDATCDDLLPGSRCYGDEAYTENTTCQPGERPSVCAVDCSVGDEELCAEVLDDSYACGLGFCTAPYACYYDGEPRSYRSVFPARDSACNECLCGDNGAVWCTDYDCDNQGCEYDGASYSVGARFRASDGCNYCGCDDDGVHCTDVLCEETATCTFAGVSYRVGETFPPDCNNCWCLEAGRAVCTDACDNHCVVERTYLGDGDEVNLEDDCNGCGCNVENGHADLYCTLEGCGIIDVNSCAVDDSRLLPVGESLPAEDGCNTCTCTLLDANPELVCTEEVCPSCTVDGEQHWVGESFLAEDGCNLCTCEGDDDAVCTERDCVANPACRLDFERGDCAGNFAAWYFDRNTGRCESALYSGCGGNDNVFRTLLDCERSCP